MSRESFLPAFLLLIIVLFLCIFPFVSSQAIVTFTEFTSIQCGNTNSATCIQCPNIANITLPSNFYTESVRCTRVPGFYDQTLAYMSSANSATLSFYFADENAALSCDADKFLYSVIVCGTSSAVSYSVVFYSNFTASNVETVSWSVNGNPVQCGSWLTNSSSNPYYCPLEMGAATFCPTTAPGYSGFSSAISFNMTIYNNCASTCNQNYNAQCLNYGERCINVAQQAASTNPVQEAQLLCGCYQAEYDCAVASGCYQSGSALLLGLANNLNLCNSSSASSSTTSTATTCPAVSVSCTSSDFGGSFGGAIFGTFIMHVITVLAFYARRKMGAQAVTVSKQTVAAEEVSMVTK